MYILRSLRKVLRTSNLPILAALTVDLGIIIAILMWNDISNGQALTWGIGYFTAGIFLSCIPASERCLRMMMGCRKLEREEKKRLMPLYLEVYAKAHIKEPMLPEDVRLYISPGESENAFATGRRSISLTEGACRLPKKQIKAVLAHEFGHLVNRDTELLLALFLENFLISLLILWKVVSKNLTGMAALFILIGFWSWAEKFLVRTSNRKNEFLADIFACELGLGTALFCQLKYVSEQEEQREKERRSSSHPSSKERMRRLQRVLKTIESMDELS